MDQRTRDNIDIIARNAAKELFPKPKFRLTPWLAVLAGPAVQWLLGTLLIIVGITACMTAAYVTNALAQSDIDLGAAAFVGLVAGAAAWAKLAK